MAAVVSDLFRACKRSQWRGRDNQQKEASFNAHDGARSLHPDYEGFTRKDGTFRAPDVTTFTDGNSVTWVRGVADRDEANRRYVSENEGVSLNANPGKFGYAYWFYFLLPQGTPIPASLDIKQTGSDRDHYSLRCLNLMRKDAYEGALDTLARSALAKAVQLSRRALYFS